MTRSVTHSLPAKLIFSTSVTLITLMGCGAGEDPSSDDSPSSGGTSNGTGGASESGGSNQSGGAPGEEATGGLINQPASGGASGTGGSPSTGGSTNTGGTTACSHEEPPSNVANWINESWDAQLGGNIEGRQSWLLDSVMQGEGQINLCVRWGATSAPSATVKAQLAPSVESWFNDWFAALGNHDCFPYGGGITAKITGWAVKPGNESWVSDLGPEIAVYTQTDGEGEPMCPSACSFFDNWDHEFPDCAGGEAFHTDYWIWVNDQLPGGGAAAVGGDWGLRMPVATLIGSLGKKGDYVIEHEMGHGFGFQDYYDWTGSRPEGGSLMIVGSTQSPVPTIGDTWLLRRTWSEMRVMRNW